MACYKNDELAGDHRLGPRPRRSPAARLLPRQAWGRLALPSWSDVAGRSFCLWRDASWYRAALPLRGLRIAAGWSSTRLRWLNSRRTGCVAIEFDIENEKPRRWIRGRPDAARVFSRSSVIGIVDACRSIWPAGVRPRSHKQIRIGTSPSCVSGSKLHILPLQLSSVHVSATFNNSTLQPSGPEPLLLPRGGGARWRHTRWLRCSQGSDATPRGS